MSSSPAELNSLKIPMILTVQTRPCFRMSGPRAPLAASTAPPAKEREGKQGGRGR